MVYMPEKDEKNDRSRGMDVLVEVLFEGVVYSPDNRILPWCRFWYPESVTSAYQKPDWGTKSSLFFGGPLGAGKSWDGMTQRPHFPHHAAVLGPI
jgi:hypothetical protein